MSYTANFKVSKDNLQFRPEEKGPNDSQSSDDGSSIMSRQSSVTSTPRSISPCRRTGINLGLSVIGDSSSLHGSSTRIHEDGDNDNNQTISTLELKELNTKARSSPRKHSISPIKEQINEAESRSQELSERLRLLASKEMQILELKNTIQTLVRRKRYLEEETALLKKNLQKEVVKRVTQEYSSTSASSARTRSSTGNSQTINQEVFKRNHVSSSGSYTNGDRKSWLASPINFLQQFDSAVTTELNNLQEPQKAHIASRNNDSRRAPHKGVDSSGREIGSPLKSLAEQRPAPSDLVQSVSQHIWSFVNDVKESISLDNQMMDASVSGNVSTYSNTKGSHRINTKEQATTSKSLVTIDPDNSQVTEDDLWDDEDLIDI